MGAYLRRLPRCQKCQAPAAQALHNAANAPVGEYCDKHAPKALEEFLASNPDQVRGW